MKNTSRRCLSLVIPTALGLMAMPIHAQPQGQAPTTPPTPPPVFSVEVTNTPLPVTGTVTATISGTPTVNATITGVPTVKIVGDPFQQAYQDAFNFAADFVGRCADNQESITVPSGKMLLITNVFVEGFVTKGHPALGVLQVRFMNSLTPTLDSSSHLLFYPPFVAAEPPSVRYPAGRDIHAGNFPTNIVAQAGQSVRVNGCAEGSEVAGTQTVEVVITGRFIDLS